MSEGEEPSSSQRTALPMVNHRGHHSCAGIDRLPARGEDRLLADDMDGYVIVDENGRTKARMHRYLWTDDYVIRDRDGRTKGYIRDHRLETNDRRRR